MNFCPNCGNEIEQNTKFCPKCGSPISESKEEVKTENSKDVVNVEPAVSTPVDAKKSNGFAIAGFVISIISFLSCGILSLLSFIFSLIGLSKSKNKEYDGKGLSIAGVIISIVSFLILVFIIICFVYFFYQSAQINNNLKNYNYYN